MSEVGGGEGGRASVQAGRHAGVARGGAVQRTARVPAAEVARALPRRKTHSRS